MTVDEAKEEYGCDAEQMCKFHEKIFEKRIFLPELRKKG